MAPYLLWHLAIVLTALIRASKTAEAPCYYPGGNQAEWHTPCNESAPVSYCCNGADACISNGYCFQQDQAGQWSNRLGRGSCTDRTFAAAECPYYCGDIGEGYAVPLLLVNNSANGSFCCSAGEDGSTAEQCNQYTRGSNKPFQIQPGQVIWDRRTGSTDPPVNGTIYATVRDVSTSTVTATSPATAANNQKMISILVGVAVPLSALLILAIVSVVLMWRRLRAAETRRQTSVQPGFEPARNEVASTGEKEEAYQLPDDSVAKHEAETDVGRHELVNDIRPVEVSAVRLCEVEGDAVEERGRH